MYEADDVRVPAYEIIVRRDALGGVYRAGIDRGNRIEWIGGKASTPEKAIKAARMMPPDPDKEETECC